MDFFNDIKQILSSDALYFTGTSVFRSVTDLLPAEAECIAQARPVRQKEFATGRWCARQLFNEMGRISAPLVCGKTGEPIWPHGVCGSISHTHDACCVVTSFTKKHCSVGLDIENIQRSISASARRMIINEDEERWIAAHRDRSENLWCTVFSIKESIGKLLFPLVRRMVPFSAVSVVRLTHNDRFTCHLNEDLGNGLVSRRTLHGRLFRNDSWIVAIAFL
jgi:enterobactin synthetase component D